MEGIVPAEIMINFQKLTGRIELLIQQRGDQYFQFPGGQTHTDKTHLYLQRQSQASALGFLIRWGKEPNDSALIGPIQAKEFLGTQKRTGRTTRNEACFPLQSQSQVDKTGKAADVDLNITWLQMLPLLARQLHFSHR